MQWYRHLALVSAHLHLQTFKSQQTFFAPTYPRFGHDRIILYPTLTIYSWRLLEKYVPYVGIDGSSDNHVLISSSQNVISGQFCNLPHCHRTRWIKLSLLSEMESGRCARGDWVSAWIVVALPEPTECDTQLLLFSSCSSSSSCSNTLTSSSCIGTCTCKLHKHLH